MKVLRLTLSLAGRLCESYSTLVPLLLIWLGREERRRADNHAAVLDRERLATMPGSSRHKATNMQKRLGLLALGLTVLGLAGHTASGADDKKKEDKKVDTRVFELRTYHANPGKMTALHTRFKDHTNKLLCSLSKYASRPAEAV